MTSSPQLRLPTPITEVRPEPGAHFTPGGGGCAFTVWAPHARQVQLAIEVGGVDKCVETRPLGNGYHYARVPDAIVGDRYAYRLDGGDERPDPASRHQPEGVHARSAIVDREFAWSDGDWFGIPLREYVIYELHVGTFTPDGTFDAIVPRLDELAQLGITAVELMPVAQFPGERNWGYDGVDLFAVQNSYGGPDGLRRLVDACHARGMAVVLDVVYNHLGPEGNHLREFGPYFTQRHSTPWGDAVNFDDRGCDDVRAFFIANALMWIDDYHIDALRLDAIHGIVDTSANPFLAELADAVHERGERLNRRAYTIAESDLNDVRVITERVAGGLGHDTQWTDDFHHALHSVLTGERDGYYADFDGIDDLAASYRQGYVYTGQESTFRGRRHGSATTGMPGERFVVYAQNHDQVGNRLLGDRLASSLSSDEQKLALAAVLLSPFVPMLFMGEEYGETAPFPYFVSHGDPQLVQAVREGRAREFEAFEHAGEAPDPQAVETFEAARLDWQASHAGHGAELRAFVQRLLELRRLPSIARMCPADVGVAVGSERRTLVLHRSHAGDETVVALNFGDDDFDLVEAAGLDDSWQLLLASDSAGEVSREPLTVSGRRLAVYGRGVVHGGETT